MLRGNKYEQHGGEHSVNLQGENVHYHGITYRDAKEIAQDVFEKNFRELSDEAGEIATQRANEVLDQIMGKLQKIEEKSLESFKDPDVQYQIFNVQKEYARNGDKDLADMLTDLLVERVKESDRNLKQILLNESMSVLPKLTSPQINILTWIFLLRRVINPNVENLSHLQNFFQEIYTPIPLEPEELRLEANYMHLQYAGCGNISIGEISFQQVFCQAYPNLFPPDSEVIQVIGELSLKAAAIADLWNDTTLKSFELTSVGITIAHSNMCRLTKTNQDLNIWIS